MEVNEKCKLFVEMFNTKIKNLMFFYFGNSRYWEALKWEQSKHTSSGCVINNTTHFAGLSHVTFQS